ncbi:uncharacterized protein RJT20DRAFT_12096 [Scheffersomyces xylosifermentans]|uniref:uncharacterized protein n=1 Tax=Scheffersomyces xylosifermentans TaxID=1304137 RepID=UPI00315D91A7
MKIITNEEREAHIAHITTEGMKGLFYGSVLSLGLFTYLKTKHPVRFNSFNTSIKTCIVTMPTIATGAFWADQGSWEFDKKMHSSEHEESKMLQEYRDWNRLSTSDKIFTALNDNKYKIILSAWAASMYGSWVFVNRDKIMNTAQKAVQARMYAQGITILLLLSTILLAMKEEEINKTKPKPIPEWKKILQQKEKEEKAIYEGQRRKQEEAAQAAAQADASKATAEN